MKFFKRILTLIIFLSIVVSAFADIPPGWDFTISPSSHLFAIPESAWPVINSNPIEPGDYIGVFYDDDGISKCGGAIEWPAEGGTVLFAYGDDNITSEKDGFAYQEPIQWRIYSWSMQVEVMATVQLDTTYPTPGNVFIPEGLSGVLNIAGGGFYVFAFADEDNLCQGYYTQLHAEPGGGSGTYSFEWTSEPPGFTSSEQNPFVQVNDTTTYTVTVTDGSLICSDYIIINTIAHPEVNAGNDDTICRWQNFSCNASSSNTQSITWSSTGDGTFNFIHSPTAIYTPGTEDMENGGTQLILSGNALNPCDIVDRDTVNVTIIPPPSAIAGEDQTACENSVIQLSGQAENYSTIEWMTLGSGTFADPNALNTVYYAENVDEEKEITIILQVLGNAPCGTAYDELILTLCPGANSNAGSDETICADQTFITNGEASHYTSIEWSSAGDGSFSNINTLNSEYFPGGEDLNNGSAYLKLSAFPASPCTEVATDSILISFQPLPEVFAGYDQIICELEDVSVSGYADHTSSILWQTSGDGTFVNPSLLATTYTPGSQDLQNENVTLTLHGSAVTPCNTVVQDELSVIFIKAPVANAGDDETICSGEIFTTSGSIQNTIGCMWASNGTGYFSDSTLLNTIYHPSQSDYNNDQVTLTLTAAANSACGAHNDDMTLSFHPLPEVDAGENQVIPFGTFTQLNGTVTGGSGDYTHHWKPEDKIIGQNILNPTTVNLESSVLFTLTSEDNNTGCANSDNMTVFVTGGSLSVDVSASPQEVCPGEEIQLQAIPSGGAGDYTFLWSSVPAGFSSTLSNPVVTPVEGTTYYVEVSDGYNQVTGDIYVTVHETPVVYAGTGQGIFHGTSTVVSGTATGGSESYSWQWSPAAILINPDQQETQTTKLYSNSTLHLTVTDTQTGCSGNDDLFIELTTGELSVTPYASPQQSCPGETVQLYANADGGAEEYIYAWFSEPPGFFSDQENPQITIEEPLRLWVEVDDGWNTTSGYTDVTVFPENQLFIETFPNDTVCAGETITLTVFSSMDPVGWVWSPGGETTPTITTDTTGMGIGTHNISVEVTDVNGCVSSKTKQIHFDICIGFLEEDDEKTFSISPNPAVGHFRITVPQGYYHARMEIVNISGVVVYTKDNIIHNSEIKTENIHRGVYMVRVYKEGLQPIALKLMVY